MHEKKVPSLDLEVVELERGRKPGGCSTSSSTSLLCTCPCAGAVETKTQG